MLACPDCGTAVAVDRCARCARSFEQHRGYAEMLPSAGISSEPVQSFYERHPFPDYQALDSPRRLIERAERSQFAAALDRQLPLREPVLEVGCGTGQLSNYLALSRRPTAGLDFCGASLALAVQFRDRFRIDAARFVQGDLFQPPFAAASYATVLALGVLHHTEAPQAGFARLVQLLRPGGHFVLGLYNRYARLPTRLRGVLMRVVGVRAGRHLDPITRRDRHADRRQRAWLQDQYFHPLEATHTVDEVLGWFDRHGLDYVNAVPPIVIGERFDPQRPLFEPGITGSRADHLACQLAAMVDHGREGGLFVMIGRRRQG